MDLTIEVPLSKKCEGPYHSLSLLILAEKLVNLKIPKMVCHYYKEISYFLKSTAENLLIYPEKKCGF